MTNEEKFRAGTVVYKDDDGDYVCELWEASTHHPDVVYHMNADGKYKKSGLRSSFFVALGGATAGPGISLATDNGRADHEREGPSFQIFPFMAIFSTNSTIYQSIRSFPKLALYGSQSYVKRGGPVMRSLNLESLICGGAVLEVHNRGLRKLNLVAQKFFIKKIFFYHIKKI